MRRKINRRYDLIPPGGIDMVARIMAYGAIVRGEDGNWRNEYPLEGEDSPLNHAIGHICQGVEDPLPVSELHQLSKAATNLLMQIQLMIDQCPKLVTEWEMVFLPRAEEKRKAAKEAEGK